MVSALVATLALVGCSALGPASPTEVVIGVVTSSTGAAALDGQQWTLGFEAGLNAATEGKNAVDGVQIVVDYRDDASDAATATSQTQALLDEGATVITGPVADATALASADAAASGHALFVAGAATTDDLTGRNRYVFRAGHQTAQEVAAAAAVLGDLTGKTVTVLAADDAAGQAYAASATAVLTARGATPAPLIVPAASTEFVPTAQKTVYVTPTAGVLVRWGGAGAPQLWRDLVGVDAVLHGAFVTQLGDPASWGQYGPATSVASFVSSWVPGAVAGADTKLVAAGDAATLGPAAADGYLAALMVVKAIGGGKGEVDGMIAALEGATIDGPTGTVTVRASDHALLADEFHVSLAASGGTIAPAVVATLAAADIAPAERPIPTTSPTPTG